MLHRLTSCYLLLALAGGACAAETVQRSVSVAIERTENVDASSRRLRLPGAFRQAGAEPIWLEIECAGTLRFVTDKAEVVRDTQASGGTCAAHIEHLTFPIAIETAGAYTAWYRALFPWGGNWLHTEQMDDGEQHTVVDSKGEVLNRWIWTSGPTYELSKGKHEWVFAPHAWKGGTRLDKVALLPRGALRPQGLGGQALRSILPPRGHAVTEPVQPPKGITQWGAVQPQNVTGKGAVAAHISADNGQTWRVVGPDGSLSALPIDAALRFKFTLTRDDSGSGPIVPVPAVTYHAKREPPIVLQNASVRWTFSGEDGAVLAIENRATNTAYLAEGVIAPLFAFRALRGRYGVLRDIAFSQARLLRVERPAANRLALHYAMMGGNLLVDVRIRLEPSGIARFSMTVENRTVYTIAEVIFPTLNGLRIGADPTDDYLFTPVVSGSIVRYPAAYLYPRAVYSDRPLKYPGTASMCWMDLWDGTGGGLYLACEDKQYRTTELTFAPGDPGAPTPAGPDTAPLPPSQGERYKYAKQPGAFISLGFNKRLLIDRTTGPVRVPDTVVGVHQGDWHWGADRYREWTQTWMRKLPPPDWWLDAEGWVDMHMVHLGDFVDLSKGWSKGSLKNTVRTPVFPMMAVWAQKASCEAFWGSQILHRLMGSPEQLAAAVQKQHEMGHLMKFYCLPPYWNPEIRTGGDRAGMVPLSEYPADEIPPADFFGRVVRRRHDGSPVTRGTRICEGGVCLGATAWQDFLTHILIDKYIAGYGSDGMYLDGGGLATYECKNLDHGHTGYGEWTPGYMAWATRLKRQARRIRPTAIFTGEGMGDIESTVLDGSLFYPDNAPHVYRYTMPDSIGILWGHLPKGYKVYPRNALAWLIVHGLKFGGVHAYTTYNRDLLDRHVAFRRRFSQFQFRARFLDEQGLTWSDPDVTGKLYTRDDTGSRGALVVAFNPKAKGGTTATVRRDRVGLLRSAWVYTLDATLHRLDVRTTLEGYQVTVPNSELSAILLLERCEPFIDVARIKPVVPGQTGTAQITVRNLEPVALTGTATLGVPRGWTAEAISATVPAGAEKRVSVPFTVAPDERYDVHQVYGEFREIRRQTRRCIPMGVCRPVQAELHWVDHHVVRLDMSSSSQSPVRGSVRLVVPEPVTCDTPTASFALDPNTAGNMTFSLRNVASVDTRLPIKAVLTYGPDTTVAHELVQPSLINGSFEQCAPNDGWPDWWNYRWPQQFYRQGAARDRSTAVHGQWSFRIDPNPKERENRVSTTFIRLVPNKRYRLHAAIRRSAHHPRIFVHFFPMFGDETGKRPFDLAIGCRKDGPLDKWEEFETEFASVDMDVPYQMILFNNTEGAATVWFDDIRIEAVR